VPPGDGAAPRPPRWPVGADLRVTPPGGAEGLCRLRGQGTRFAMSTWEQLWAATVVVAQSTLVIAPQMGRLASFAFQE